VFLAGAPVRISGTYVLAHAFGTILCLVLGELWMRTQWVTRQLGILAVLGLLAFAIAYPLTHNQPPYAAISRVLAPYLKDSQPAYPSYVADGCDVLRGYTERTGLCFDDLDHERTPAQQDPRIRAFVFGPGQTKPPTQTTGNAQEAALQDWTEHNTRDVTDALIQETGSDSGYHIRVR
jgi:hypothetical protein